ncbi:hypothetical protein ACMU_17645 [Actibacterium mucosum KCTC 23349]|uniref:Alginate lyase domain-containing protein n=1 Tax=Actibacterium mucosum KCTC 23349 TaxID=1454373 RepID=A0A037ZEH0_9RHOB|nr:alginate lyase family protein [Actibacterium mucosum]KAJ54532.1 hypothetical protein ACMU_17645 [Actibacterium mucosum KCTC 23349]
MTFSRGVWVLVLAVSCQFLPAQSAIADTPIGPKFFIANSLGPGCTRDAKGRGPRVSAVNRAMGNLYKNSQAYVNELNRSTSLTAKKDAYVANWQPILFNAYAAAAKGDTRLARAIIDGLRRMAASGLYLNEKGLLTRKAALKVQCYKNGPNSPCPSHTPRFVARMYANLFIAAAVLQPFMTDEDRKIILPWFKAAHKKFVLPEVNAKSDGIYDFANNGLTQWAYAALTGDKRLAMRELAARKREFTKVIQTSGYIKDNSCRGVRALWYHTYGLDPALSYALVAREWGVDMFRDAKLGPRLQAAVQKTALGVTDYAAFRSVGNRGDSYSTNPKDAQKHIHQLALNLPLIAKREFGITLPSDRRYLELRRYEAYSSTSGLLASCYYSGR